ncbi:MAG: K(+)-transporting ATPase subunit F [Thiotrichales bacterium]
MNLIYLVAGVVTIGLLIYLVLALLKPERFRWTPSGCCRFSSIWSSCWRWSSPWARIWRWFTKASRPRSRGG